MRVTPLVLLSLLAQLAAAWRAPCPAAAQDTLQRDSPRGRSADSATIIVTVTRAESGLPLYGARVTLRHAAASAATDSRGIARLDGVPPGTDTVDIRLLGYQPQRRAVTSRAGEVLRLAVALERLAQPLDTVRVTARQRALPFDNGFAMRRKAGFGQFISHDDVQHRHAAHTSDLLRGIPGVLVTYGRGGPHIAMARNTSHCHVRYWLDGVLVPDDEDLPSTIATRVSRPNASGQSSNQPPVMVDRLNQDLPTFHVDMLRPEEIESIEIYRGPSETPAQFRVQGATCGVIVIWTRSS
ncbi:MAG TPA: carboxypeptidase regulatory-like domain-containing protein [Gemmatimonadaceae bacterium]|nr:carboxypeptidase regulatory-like domain-containing protein [Gemmatimonadaceae bacterium]